MTVIASCGHEIPDWPKNEYSFCIKDFVGMLEPAIRHMNACKSCYEFYKREGMILETEQEKQDWLDGMLDY